MGREWKHHKYIRKEGKRYFYDDKALSVDDLTGIESPDMNELGNELEKVFPATKLREILDTPIYSPRKEDVTVMSKASDFLKGKRKKDKMLAKEEK